MINDKVSENFPQAIKQEYQLQSKSTTAVVIVIRTLAYGSNVL